jgi:4-aminobutyrate aminotransferase-like enzyme
MDPSVPMTPSNVLALLQAFESPNITFVDPDGSWPIVWEKARGVFVWDLEGKKYLDLTAAFGVAAAGHANPRVVRAGQKQMARLLHAMGDVHPHRLKALLVRELSRLTFERWSPTSQTAKTILTNSGFEAVEAALKTAALATGRLEVIAFEKGYHGLGYGALNVTHRDLFRSPFLGQLREFAHFLPFPTKLESLDDLDRRIRILLNKSQIGAVLVEPIQVRGGVNIPPDGFLTFLRRICDEYGVLLVLDEIYTGFGRTGSWFACERSKTIPDLICLGKALTGGFPMSACVGRANLMDKAWPPSNGEAIHTSTFLGHPVGCAMALAQMSELEKGNLVDKSARNGLILSNELSEIRDTAKLHIRCRSSGLLAGVELNHPDGSPASGEAMKVVKSMLSGGYIVLPEGEHGNVIGITPPLTLSTNQLRRALAQLKAEIVAAS